MRRLDGARELLDGPIDEATLRGNLRDLARVNRWLGGADLSWRALGNVLAGTSPGSVLRILDVGTGAADIPIALASRARRAGRQLQVTATDIRPEIVAIAAENVRRAGLEEVSVRAADPLLATEAAQSADVVHASLVLHHFDPPEAQELLRAMWRVSRSVVIVNDLDRGRLWWLAAWLASHVLTANRYTRNDAPLSVRRAYRPQELARVAAAAGLREAASHVARPGHRYALTFVRGDHRA